jgi:hypothetical protein
VPDGRPAVVFAQTSNTFESFTLKSPIQSPDAPVEAVQLTLSWPPGATIFAPAVTVYTPGATGDGVTTGAGITAVGAGPVGELALQPRVVPTSAARTPWTTTEETTPGRGLFDIDVPSVSEAENSRDNVNAAKKA